MKKKTGCRKITDILTHDPMRKIILWKDYPLRYRVALMIMPKSELAALCQFFGVDKEALETRFNLI